MQIKSDVLTEKPVGGTLDSLTVLVVDDIQENLDLLQEVLSEHGYKPISTNSGFDALQKLETETVHIVIADAMMPSIDGFQLCKHVKGNPRLGSIPFIIYTGNYVDQEDVEFAKSIGVDSYVMKFDGLGALVDALNDLSHKRYDLQVENLLHDAAPITTPSQEVDEQTFLEKHHAIIVKKLEQKMKELEVYAETLAYKNREIEASEARYRGLFEDARVGVFILEQETGRIIDVNREGLALLGFSKEELLAMPGLPLIEGQQFSPSSIRVGANFSGEVGIRTRDGRTVEVEIGAGPVVQPNDSRILLFALDVTERKKMQQKLLQAEKMTLMGCLAAGIAHDIRNPLAAISLNVQYLLRKIDPESPDRGSLEFAMEGVHRIGKVIDNTLGLARITPPLVRPEKINTIVQHSLKFLNSSFQKKSLSVECDLVDDLPSIAVEAKQIEQVVLNVLQNAIDASPEGGIITVSTCQVEGFDGEKTAQGSFVALVICDRGPGISPEEMKHLFEPFHTTKPDGTGLGLALSKQIMDKHNAILRIEPALGGGTIARLVFQVQSS